MKLGLGFDAGDGRGLAILTSYIPSSPCNMHGCPLLQVRGDPQLQGLGWLQVVLPVAGPPSLPVTVVDVDGSDVVDGPDVVGPLEGINASHFSVNVLQHPSQGAHIGVVRLQLIIELPLQLLHLPEVGEYLAHHVLGLMIGSQDLVNGGLGERDPSDLTMLAHIIPSMTPNPTTLCPWPSVSHPTGSRVSWS